MKINKLLILLSALLLMMGMVGSVSAIRFKNAILLNESGFTPFAIRLNDSFEITGDINVSLFNSSGGSLNFIGYSSKNSINVNDVIVYQQDGSSLGYQDAKTNGWIEGINISDGSSISIEAVTLNEYGAYWVNSFTGVNLKFIGVGGSNTSTATNISWNDLLFYNGSIYLNITNAASEEWVNSFSIFYWGLDGFGDLNFLRIPFIKKELNTWEGYLKLGNKPNIYLLFENKTLNVEITRELYMGLKENGVEVLSITRQTPTKLTLGFFIEIAREFWKSWNG